MSQLDDVMARRRMIQRRARWGRMTQECVAAAALLSEASRTASDAFRRFGAAWEAKR